MRRHNDPKRKTAQAQKTPTTPTNRHKLKGTTPDQGHCTRYVAAHPNRRGVMPTDRVQRPNTQEQTRN